jgi:rod shape-determining protein MreB
MRERVGIDLGTANVLVWIQGKGIVVNEPAMVAREVDSGRVVAVGKKAKQMWGRVPKGIEVIRPLRNGVVADYEAAEEMLVGLVKRVLGGINLPWPIFKPRIVVGVPSGVTEVERLAVGEAIKTVGAGEVWIVEEAMAAAVGAGIPVNKASGYLIVDIGGGTTETAIISLGGMVVNQSIRMAGDEMTEAIINFAQMKHGLVIGEITAEQCKIEIGSAYLVEKKKSWFVLRGRDLETGLPRSMKVNSDEVREALGVVVRRITQIVGEMVEKTPPELVGDLVKHGLTLVGGGSQLKGLDKLLEQETKMPVWLVNKPAETVAKGAGKLWEDENLLARVAVRV